MSSRISRNAVSKLVPCSAFALGVDALEAAFFFMDDPAAVGKEIVLQESLYRFFPFSAE
jgi:hypothetical protein